MPLTEYDIKMLSTRLPLKASKIFLQNYHTKHNVSFTNHPEVIREEGIKRELERREQEEENKQDKITEKKRLKNKRRKLKRKMKAKLLKQEIYPDDEKIDECEVITMSL